MLPWCAFSEEAIIIEQRRDEPPNDGELTFMSTDSVRDAKAKKWRSASGWLALSQFTLMIASVSRCGTLYAMMQENVPEYGTGFCSPLSLLPLMRSFLIPSA